jgi:hypothetical protein
VLLLAKMDLAVVPTRHPLATQPVRLRGAMVESLSTQVAAFLLSQGIIGIVLYLVVISGHLDPRRLTEMARERVGDFEKQVARLEAQADEWRQLYLQERATNTELTKALGLERQRADRVVEKVAKAIIKLEELGPPGGRTQ